MPEPTDEERLRRELAAASRRIAALEVEKEELLEQLLAAHRARRVLAGAEEPLG
jgi:hypothetical protein